MTHLELWSCVREIGAGSGGTVAALLGIFAAFQIFVRLLSGPVSEIRTLLDEVVSFFNNEIQGRGSQADTWRMRYKMSVISPRAPWPMRRRLRRIDRQIPRFNRPGGNAGRMMWPTLETATEAVVEGSTQVNRAHAYLDRLGRWTLST